MQSFGNVAILCETKHVIEIYAKKDVKSPGQENQWEYLIISSKVKVKKLRETVLD